MVYENLRKICRHSGITFKEIEEKANLGAGCISRWKEDKVTPNVDTLVKIATVLKIPVADLLKGE